MAQPSSQSGGRATMDGLLALPEPSGHTLLVRPEEKAIIRAPGGYTLNPHHPAVQGIHEKIAAGAFSTSFENVVLAHRLWAMFCFPKSRPTGPTVTMDQKLGRDRWMRVVYSVKNQDQPYGLPFGLDVRLMLEIVHLALVEGQPLVYFDQLAGIMRQMGFDRTDGRSRKDFHDRFCRLANLLVLFLDAPTQEALAHGPSQDSYDVLSRRCIGPRDPRIGPARYGFQLGADFFALVSEPESRLAVHREIIHALGSHPTALHYCLWLMARLAAARSESFVPADAPAKLITGYSEGRKAVQRLREIHATLVSPLFADRVNVDWVPTYQRSRGGRRPVKWLIRVGPGFLRQPSGDGQLDLFKA